MDWFPQPEHGGFYQALLAGYYREAGLDVKILPGGPQEYPIQKVAVLQAQFGIANSDNVTLAVAQKLPVQCVAAYLQHSPLGLMLHADSRVKSFADLEGTTIGVPSGATWYALMLKKYGYTKIKQQTFYSPSIFLVNPAFIQQAIVTSQPYYVEKKGAKVRFLLVKDLGYDPYGVLFVNRPYAEKHPEVVRAFVKASQRGWTEYLKNPDAVHAYLSKQNPQLESEGMVYSHRKLVEYGFVDGDPAHGDRSGWFDFARLATEFHTLLDLGLIHPGLEPKDVFTNQYLTPSTP
jgi:NitT/TauT family transport system substrate-binding protein